MGYIGKYDSSFKDLTKLEYATIMILQGKSVSSFGDEGKQKLVNSALQVAKMALDAVELDKEKAMGLSEDKGTDPLPDS